MGSTPRPIIVFIRGLPGSGKTYLTERLAKKLGPSQASVLDPDATDYESKAYKEHTDALTAGGVDKKLHPYRFLRAQAFEAIEEGKIILWNQPFTNLEAFRKVVAKMKEYATDHNKDLSILIVEVSVDDATAKKRVTERKNMGGHGPSDDTFARFINEYTSFGNEGFATVTVHGTDDVSKSVEIVEQAIKDSLSSV